MSPMENEHKNEKKEEEEEDDWLLSKEIATKYHCKKMGVR